MKKQYTDFEKSFFWTIVIGTIVMIGFNVVRFAISAHSGTSLLWQLIAQ